jgi:hypothetical protein
MQIREAAKVRNRQTTWYVTSDTTPGVEYIVHNKRNVVSHHMMWTCNCPDFTERQQFKNGQCKHITAVQNHAVNQEYVSLPTVNQVIDTIVRVLNGPRDQAKQLWDVLTILRGPDNDDSALKAVTTAPLRGAIGLNPGTGTGAIINHDDPFGKNVESGIEDYHRIMDKLTRIGAQPHFAAHYRLALLTLKSLGYVK